MAPKPVSTTSTYELPTSFAATHLPATFDVDQTKTHQPLLEVTITQSITITGNVMQWVYTGMGILCLINNLFVVFVILRSHNMRKDPRSWFLFHQSLADTICAIFVLAASTKNASLKLEVCYYISAHKSITK